MRASVPPATNVGRCQATDSPINPWDGEAVGVERKTTVFRFEVRFANWR